MGSVGSAASVPISQAQPLPQLKSAADAGTVGHEIAVSDTNWTASTRYRRPLGWSAVRNDGTDLRSSGIRDKSILFDYADIRVPSQTSGSNLHVRLTSFEVDRGPYLVVQVDRRLMNGHGGIYTPAIMEFVTRVANNRFFLPGAAR